MTVWQSVSVVAAQMPLSKEKLEKALGVQFTARKQDEHLSHWLSNSLT